jgi:hypothetical protein
MDGSKGEIRDSVIGRHAEAGVSSRRQWFFRSGFDGGAHALPAAAAAGARLMSEVPIITGIISRSCHR